VTLGFEPAKSNILPFLPQTLVSKWERGEKRPSGASLKMLSLVAKNGLATVA
jgi:putative transcriptional regulator